MFKARKLREGIYWVGATDWSVRNFHGYSTERGSTYNAYLLVSDKIALIDTVKPGFSEEMLSRIRSVVDPSKIDFVVSNHAEPDHSGALREIAEIAPNAEIYTVAGSGKKALSLYYGELPLKEIRTGDKLNLGKLSLSFVQTPMVHWPDNMVSYCEEEKILFSNDAFGQHFASSGILDVENDAAEIAYQAKKYYANIVNPYTAQVEKALAALAGLDIGLIAPSHGVLWTNPGTAIELYRSFIGARREKAVVVFDSMWHSTERMAEAVAETFREAGLDTKVCDLKVWHNSDILTELLDAKILAVGSPCLNSNIMPTVSAFLCYLKGLKYDPKRTVVFGSYGWNPAYLGEIEQTLAGMKYVPLLPAFKNQFRPDDAAIAKLKSELSAALTGAEG